MLQNSRRLSANAAKAFAQGQKRSTYSANVGSSKKPNPAKKPKRYVKAFQPKQTPSTGQKSAKPKRPYQGTNIGSLLELTRIRSRSPRDSLLSMTIPRSEITVGGRLSFITEEWESVT